jgi:2-iminobutanoate/2-iminopropanoate deaminase
MDSQARRCFSSSRLAPAVGPYSPAVRHGDLLYCSGMLPLDPTTGQIVAGDITAQTRQVLDNLQVLLADCGTALGNVLKTTVFLHNMDDFATFNAVYAEYFPTAPPARSTVQVARLPLDALIEIEAIVSVRD